MNRVEHLVENALTLYDKVLRGQKDYSEAADEFITNEINIDLAADCELSLSQAWNIAMYVGDWWLKEMIEHDQRRTTGLFH